MRLLDAFFATRPLLLIPAWSFFLLGTRMVPDTPVAWPRLLLLSAILVATHLLNQVVDRDTDARNDKGFFLQRGIFTARAYTLVAWFLMSGALGVAWSLGEAVVGLGLAALLGLAYNLPPLRLSHRPLFDLLANALGYGGIAFVLGQSPEHLGQLQGPVLATTAAVASVFLHTTLLDVDGDRAQGKRTSGVVLGPRATPRLALLLAAVSTAAAVLANNVFLWAPCAVVLLTCVRSTSQRVVVWGSTAFAVAAAIAHWWFGVGLLGLILGTRRYYAHRFARRYPAF